MFTCKKATFYRGQQIKQHFTSLSKKCFSSYNFGVSSEESALTELRGLCYQHIVADYTVMRYRPAQEKKGLYRNEWARSAPTSEAAMSACWPRERWCRRPKAAARRRSDSRFRPFQLHTLYWQQKLLPPPHKTRLQGELPRTGKLRWWCSFSV